MQSVAELNTLSGFAIYVGKHDTWISERSEILQHRFISNDRLVYKRSDKDGSRCAEGPIKVASCRQLVVEFLCYNLKDLTFKNPFIVTE